MCALVLYSSLILIVIKHHRKKEGFYRAGAPDTKSKY
jgi:hypothetical protein